ncbi:MAG TPA: DUF1801 domain-containing protein [Caulobacteraceae bacterium]|nr:DUF1801 domain-containing protein [Caulobacteraceae bacterium]
MVQSQAASVEAYIAQASPDRAALLSRIRKLARQVLGDHEERMQWGMPVYARGQVISFGFAEQKRYVSLYFVNPSGLRKNSTALSGLSLGKNCIRLRGSSNVDWDLLERLLVDTRDAAPEPASRPREMT